MEIFGNQEIKSKEKADEVCEVREDRVKPIQKVEKRRIKSMVPCTSPGKMFEYSKYTQDGGYVPEAVRNAQVGTKILMIFLNYLDFLLNFHRLVLS